MMARQAKILVAEAEENNSDDSQWHRWHTCSLCEQEYHGVVRCALGWACWKAYMGRPEIWPEANLTRRDAMNQLGNGLHAASHYEDALTVREAELFMKRRLGVSEEKILVTQGNIANTYLALRQPDQALWLRRDVYSGFLKLLGEESIETLTSANNYAMSLKDLSRFNEARALLRKVMPVARRVLG